MYLYKYFYKGVDYTTGNLCVDDISQYIRGRYLSASEAVWRIFEYDVTRREPSVQRYPVHLENENYVVYNSKDDLSRKRAQESISKLERYFKRPLAVEFEDLKYLDYYEKYMVNNKPAKRAGTKLWTDEAPQGKWCSVCEKDDVHVARMDSKQLHMGDVRYLRLVLRHKSARSYR